ncbi:ABC transporter permease [Cohnella herbarum]|uniref:Sugar ABC transporter permease n=1 Tax=Cohnella herbarum TaxID=2728023 RepID=A0A7Z2ZK18_9BACL|nr:ABC transporter permease subunit [Cohnella herbarum]QJD82370.1 sugar ABC transporter permease [Cohnella herbarum]
MNELASVANKNRTLVYLRKTWPLHLLLLPALVISLVYQYAPILMSFPMAFREYQPWLGFRHSPWVGLDHFRYLFTYPQSKQVLFNTLLISIMKIGTQLTIPVMFALLLNEVRHMLFKRSVQTLVYLPHFMSWVILGGILTDLLSIQGGLVNRFLGFLGVEPIFFLANGDWFRFTIVLSDIWKEFGFSSIIFLAAIAGVNPSLYEAAEIDGAGRWKQTLFVTLPGIAPIFTVVAALSLGRVLDGGYDQILNLYNPLVMEKGDIIDTFVYRVGLQSGNFSFGTAVGLFKSAIGFVLIVIAYRVAYKYAKYRIF